MSEQQLIHPRNFQWGFFITSNKNHITYSFKTRASHFRVYNLSRMGKKPFYSFAQDVYAFPIVRLNIVDVFSTLIYVRTQFLCGFLTVILEGA